MLRASRTLGHRGERCPACLKRFEELLRATYGEVRVNYKLPGMGAHLEDFRTSKHYGTLARIYAALQDCRGHREFVRAKALSPCDFFVPDPGFIVELDERQHFTQPRKLVLSLYPQNVKLAFDRSRWMRLCDDIAARDNDPPYRDEQRAWYETLRDFAPELIHLRPTVRIRRVDSVWCGMEPLNRADTSAFEAIIKYIKEDA